MIRSTVKNHKFPKLMVSRTSGAIFMVHAKNATNPDVFSATVVFGKTAGGITAGHYHKHFHSFSQLEDYTGTVELSNGD